MLPDQKSKWRPKKVLRIPNLPTKWLFKETIGGRGVFLLLLCSLGHCRSKYERIRQIASNTNEIENFLKFLTSPKIDHFLVKNSHIFIKNLKFRSIFLY